MNWPILIIAMLLMLVFLAVTGGMPWFFVGLLQGGVGIIVFFVRELGIFEIPEGVTLPLIAVLTAIGGAFILVRFPDRWGQLLSPLSVSVLVFSLLVILGIFYSWHDLAIEKALKYVAANLISFVVVLCLSSPQRQKLYNFLIWVAVAITFGLLINFVSSNQGALRGRYGTFGIDTITASRSVGLGLILVLHSQRYRRYRWVYSVFLGMGIFLAASRGPVVALIITAFLQPLLIGNQLFRFRISRRVLWLFGGSVLALLALFTWVALFPPETLAENWGPLRLVRETTIQNANIISRFEHWKIALEDWRLRPWLGMGTGGYSGSALGRDQEALSYPHNIFLEILSEWGLIGGVLFVLILWWGVVRLRYLGSMAQNTANPLWIDEVRMVSAIFVFTLLNACVSAEIYNNRTLWLALGAVGALSYEVARHFLLKSSSRAMLEAENV